MHSGQWFGWKKDWTGSHRMSYENIIVHDSSITKPTEAEVNAKIQELKDAEQATINKKASGKQKLKDLGLDDDEIQALMGA
jgi:arsenate reductase-like glutaredoxin family protein